MWMSAKLMPEYATSIATSSSPGGRAVISRSFSAEAGPILSMTMSRCMSRACWPMAWTRVKYTCEEPALRLQGRQADRELDDQLGSLCPGEEARDQCLAGRGGGAGAARCPAHRRAAESRDSPGPRSRELVHGEAWVLRRDGAEALPRRRGLDGSVRGLRQPDRTGAAYVSVR